MSTHSLKAKRRHPDTQRERITVGHITFELSTRDKTFALVAGDLRCASQRQKTIIHGVYRARDGKRATQSSLPHENNLGR